MITSSNTDISRIFILNLKMTICKKSAQVSILYLEQEKNQTY